MTRPSRRSLLKGLAALPVTLSFAKLLRADTPPPRRLVLIMQNNGTQQANFWPRAADLSSPILDSLFLEPRTRRDLGLRAKTNLIKGVYIPFDANGLVANQHDMGFARMFTGAPLLGRGGQPWGGAMSVDQRLAALWGVDTLALAVLASQTEPHPKPGFNHRESFSYLGPATIKHPRKDPLEVYNYLFAPPVDSKHGHRRRVLDAVTGNLSELSARLGATERAKLDYHRTAIEDVRRRLDAHYACKNVPPPPQNYQALDPRAEISIDTYIPEMVDDMIDLGVLALKCGITPIVTLQLGYGGGKWRFAWEGIDINAHDLIAHYDTSDAGSSPTNTQRLVLINQYYASCVQRLCRQLDAIPEGSGTMLDNTLVVWANELGRGDHNQANVPIVLIGRAGGALPVGGRVIDQGPQVFNRLGCTILNVMGVPTAGFGDEPSCGSFAGLL